MIDPNDITTIRVGELPPNPPTLESKIPHELGTDLNYFTITQLIEFLQPYVGVFQYETKRLAVTQAYIDENFDETGLGRNICIGWAIRNGSNGTDNIDGKVAFNNAIIIAPDTRGTCPAAGCDGRVSFKTGLTFNPAGTTGIGALGTANSATNQEKIDGVLRIRDINLYPPTASGINPQRLGEAVLTGGRLTSQFGIIPRN